MRWGRYGIAVLLLIEVLGGGRAVQAQSAPAEMAQASPQTGLAGEFGSLASRAALIFVGQVVRIERRSGAVEIVFQVEQAVLGEPGAQYTLREWSGLWPQGQFRYTVGQRALMFLHGPSAAGFGSPVDGAEGVVPVIVQGADAPELLDIRRLSAALQRAPGTPPASVANGAMQLAAVLPLIAAGVEQAGTTRLPRPEPIRLPLPVHSGMGGSLAGGASAGGANGGALGLPILTGTTGSMFSQSPAPLGPVIEGAGSLPIVRPLAVNQTGAGVRHESR